MPRLPMQKGTRVSCQLLNVNQSLKAKLPTERHWRMNKKRTCACVLNLQD